MKWKRPSGTEIETNDLPDTIAYCKSIGWKPVEQKKRKRKSNTREAIDEHK